MSERAPIRLRDDPAVARALRADLARAAARPPVAYDVAAGLARFEQAQRIGVSAGGSGAASSVATGVNGGTILGAALKGALLGVVAVGGATLVEPRPPAGSPGPQSVEPAVSVAHTAAARPAPPTTSARSIVPASLDAAKPPGLREAGRDGGAPRTTPAPAAVATSDPIGASVFTDVPAPAAPASGGDALAAEMEHLARLRALGDRDPAQALALAAEGSRRFPTGLFAQEREAIAIGALVRLGRVPEARARAAAFVASYPRSAFVERIQKISGIGAEQ
jgi:hypothetical protein